MSVKNIFLGAVSALIVMSQVAGSEKNRWFHYDFSENGGILLKEGAVIKEQVLCCNGLGAYAVVPGSNGMNLSEKGMTLTASVKFADSGMDSGKKESYDIIFYKENSFLFGRLFNRLYVNIHDGKKWAAPILAGMAPKPGVWTHYTVVFDRFNDVAQGDIGYEIRIFVNGEPVASRRIQRIEPNQTDAPVEFGKGLGGGPWFFHGEISDAAMFGQALSGANASKLFRQSRVAQKIRNNGIEFSPALEKELKSFQKISSDGSVWISECLGRATAAGFDQQKILDALKKTAEADGGMELFSRFTRAQNTFGILLTDQLAVMTVKGKGTGHPILGILNRKDGRELLGPERISWKIGFLKGPQKAELDCWTKGVSFQSEVNGTSSVRVIWKGLPPLAFEAESVITVRGARMESTFSATSKSPAVLISDLTYPVCNLARLPGKKDYLVHPFMSGVCVPDPTEKCFRYGQEGWYPSGKVTFQFGAYYDHVGNGIYFGHEDPLGKTKYYSVSGRNGGLHISWKTPVPWHVNETGGNRGEISGKAVLELYQGEWYEAGRIYRRFLEREATWWIRDIPRRSSPEWLLKNTMWILGYGGVREQTEEIFTTVSYLRSYFELPFAIHWYGWEDNERAGWPHFPAKNFVREVNRKLQRAGIYTVPYTNSRLWKIKDGPRNTDLKYGSEGSRYAVRNPDGSVNEEIYGKNRSYAVMCPAAHGWQKHLIALSERLAEDGFNGVYHDQVGTGAPHLCFFLDHGHLLNDPSVWIEKGYVPIFETILESRQKRHPSFCHTTEENAEPYLKCFDGFLVWRWTDQEQIPLFQSIYSGRIQFVGRLFNTAKPGDKQSFFSKVGQQLVNAEQIGWFPVSELRDNDERRLFVKKAMHMRYALLPWFNGGEMLAPLRFHGPLPTETSLWGGMIPQKVTMPKIASSAWLGADHSRMYLFVNTKQEEVSATPMIREWKDMWICREGAESPIQAGNHREVKLKGRTFEVWIAGNRNLAEKVQTTMKKISRFDMGKPPSMFSGWEYKKTTGTPGKMFSPRDVAGTVGCAATSDGSHLGWIQDGAIISFGEIDFGSKGAHTFTLRLAVSPNFAGGSIEILTAAESQSEVQSGFVKLNTTGGWDTYKNISVPLKQKLRGLHRISFRINGNAACNFEGWKYE